MVNPEALIWISGILVLALIDVNGSSHFSVCPFKNIGIDFCPGCGLGKSIHYLLSLEIEKSLNTHPLGLFAFTVLVRRIYVLTKSSFNEFNKIILQQRRSINMINLLQLMPNIEPEELSYIQGMVKDFSDDQIRQFANIYNSRRKDPQIILLLTLVGFLGVSGVQRFVIDQIGMGLLYLFTGGLCLIGTIVDIVNHKRLAIEYNQKVANQVSGMLMS